jgi:hypothetical protein
MGQKHPEAKTTLSPLDKRIRKETQRWRLTLRKVDHIPEPYSSEKPCLLGTEPAWPIRVTVSQQEESPEKISSKPEMDTGTQWLNQHQII